MSAEHPDLEALASAHLDRECSPAEWRDARATHGQALEQALRNEQLRRAALASLPQASLPPALRAGIMDAVRSTRVGAPEDADRAPPAADPTTAAAADSQPVIRGPRWWWGAIPVVLAAGLLVAVWPMLEDPEAESAASDQHLAAAPQREPTEAAAAAPSATADAASEPVIVLEEAAAEDLVADAGQVDQAAASGGAAASGRTASTRSASSRQAEPAAAATTAKASPPSTIEPPAATAAPKPPPETAFSAAGEDGLSELEFGELLADARRFEAAAPAETPAAAEPGVSAEVTRDAMAAELRRRGVDHDTVDATFATAERSAGVRLGITMGLIPGDRAEVPPELELLLVNHGERELDGLESLLELQGLDEHGRVIWRRNADAPAGAVVEPGDKLRWRLPLSDDRLPPPEVHALRLAGAGLVGEPLPLR